MEMMEAAAAHDILVISDSDVRVTPDYLRAVALPFADEKVGAITCPYRGVAAEGGLWARLEAVGMSVEMTAGVLVARMMEGMQFTLGPTMAFRRETIRRMGGFKVTADYCADDFVLGNETFKLGQTVVLSHHAIDHMVINSSFWSSMKHQVRWMKSTRFSRPKGHFGTALTFSMPFGLLGLAAGVLHGTRRLGSGVVCVERGDAACAVDCRRAAGGARSKLVEPAGALSVARPDGILLLGGELYGQSAFCGEDGCFSCCPVGRCARRNRVEVVSKMRKRLGDFSGTSGFALMRSKSSCRSLGCARDDRARVVRDGQWFPRSQKRDPSTSLRAALWAPPRFSVPLAPQILGGPTT